MPSEREHVFGMPPLTETPIILTCAQKSGFPRRHHSQRPQEPCNATMPLRSPTLREVMPEPTATISPQARDPRCVEIHMEYLRS